jgi:hypothetical protein
MATTAVRSETAEMRFSGIICIPPLRRSDFYMEIAPFSSPA